MIYEEEPPTRFHGEVVSALKKINLERKTCDVWKTHSLRKRGRPPLSDEMVLRAILFVMRTGLPWRDLPSSFGHWNTLFKRWRKMVREGVWTRVLARLTRKSRGRYRFIDSTFMKVHQHGQGAVGGSQPQQIGLTKGGHNTKCFAVVNGQGKAVLLMLFPGQTAETTAAEAALASLKKKIVVGDKGFDSDAFRIAIHELGGLSCIPPRANRIDPFPWDLETYRQRHKVENYFQRIKEFRRVATRYDKTATSFLGFITLASITDWLKL